MEVGVRGRRRGRAAGGLLVRRIGAAPVRQPPGRPAGARRTATVLGSGHRLRSTQRSADEHARAQIVKYLDAYDAGRDGLQIR